MLSWAGVISTSSLPAQSFIPHGSSQHSDGHPDFGGLALSQPFSAAPHRPVGCCTLGDLKGRLPAVCQESRSSLQGWFGGQWLEVGIPRKTGGNSLWTPGVMNNFFCWIPAQIIIKWQYWEKLWRYTNILADLKINLIFFCDHHKYLNIAVKLWIKLIYP